MDITNIKNGERTEMTSQRQDLIQAVSQVQNMLICPIDIVTFCGWSDTTTEDIKVHLESYVRRIQQETNEMIGRRRRSPRKRAA